MILVSAHAGARGPVAAGRRGPDRGSSRARLLRAPASTFPTLWSSMALRRLYLVEALEPMAGAQSSRRRPDPDRRAIRPGGRRRLRAVRSDRRPQPATAPCSTPIGRSPTDLAPIGGGSRPGLRTAGEELAGSSRPGRRAGPAAWRSPGRAHDDRQARAHRNLMRAMRASEISHPYSCNILPMQASGALDGGRNDAAIFSKERVMTKTRKFRLVRWATPRS
jgi:hypothetical protein